MMDRLHCMDARIFNETLVGIEMLNLKMLLTKPSYVGCVVMELIKLHTLNYAIHTDPLTLSYFQFDCANPYAYTTPIK